MVSQIFIVIALFLPIAIADRRILVRLPLGVVRGQVIENEYVAAKFNHFISFKGLRYAKAVTEETKFLAASEPEPWDGVYDATEHCYHCLNYNVLAGIMGGELDCLCLNVYTPILPRDNSEKCKPVMIFIHGGAFVFGRGNSDYYSADFLLRDGDVVVVTINYRLAITGFMNGKTKTIAGNQGLKDQRAALRWVKKYIKYFGGCSNKITLFGESSGSASTQYLLFSNTTNGLFHQIIQESGSAADHWAFTTIEDDSFFFIAKTVGIKSKNREVIAEELTKRPAKDLMSAWMTDKSLADFSRFRFIPSIEVPFENEEPMILETPFKMIAKGRARKIPIMIGVNSDEGGLLATQFLAARGGTFTKLLLGYEKSLPYVQAMTPAEKKKFIESVQMLYIGTTNDANMTLKNAIDLITDVNYFTQFTMGTKFLNYHNFINVYKYHLQYRSFTGGFKNNLKFDRPVCIHTDELFMLFYSEAFNNIPRIGSPEEKIMLTMTQLWKNFAITGNPTPYLNDITPVQWPRMGKNNNIFSIGNNKMWVQNRFYEKRMKFWINLEKHFYGNMSVLFD